MHIHQQVGFIILINSGKSERIRPRHGAGGADDLPEGAFLASARVSPKVVGLARIRVKPGEAYFSEEERARISKAAAVTALQPHSFSLHGPSQGFEAKFMNCGPYQLLSRLVDTFTAKIH